MSAAIGAHEADATLVGLLPVEHLPRCPHHRGRPARRARRWATEGQGCDWCAWSWITPATRTLASIERDAGVLAKVADPGVPGAVAWRRLADLRREAAAELEHPQSEVPRELGRHLLDRVDDALERSGRPWSAGSAVTVRTAVLETAAALAAAACSPKRERHRLDLLPPSLADEVGRVLDDVPEHLSAATQVAMLLPAVDLRLDRELPELWSQPEMQRRHRPETDPLRAAKIAPGTLESLVLERIVDELTEQLLGLGPRLCEAAAEVPMRRAAHHPTGAARRLTWRLLAVDWHGTWVDAADGPEVVEVPWHLAVAVDVAAGHGRSSMLAPPEMERR